MPRRPLHIRYLLDPDGNPIPCLNPAEGERLLEDVDARTLGFDKFGDLEVSTIFLVINHSMGRPGPPVLWETGIFRRLPDGTRKEVWAMRYRSRDAAKKGHLQASEWARQSMKGPPPDIED